MDFCGDIFFFFDDLGTLSTSAERVRATACNYLPAQHSLYSTDGERAVAKKSTFGGVICSVHGLNCLPTYESEICRTLRYLGS